MEVEEEWAESQHFGFKQYSVYLAKKALGGQRPPSPAVAKAEEERSCPPPTVCQSYSELRGSPPTPVIATASCFIHRGVYTSRVALLSSSNWSLPRWEERPAPRDPHPPKLEAFRGWGRQVRVGRPSGRREHRRQRRSSAAQRLGEGEDPTAVLQRNPIPTLG